MNEMNCKQMDIKYLNTLLSTFTIPLSVIVGSNFSGLLLMRLKKSYLRQFNHFIKNILCFLMITYAFLDITVKIIKG